MAQWGGAQGQVKVAKKNPFVAFPPETPTKNEKFYFSISTKRHAESAEGLNSSLAQSHGEL